MSIEAYIRQEVRRATNMSGPEFFQTQVGSRFFNAHVPALIEQLSKLNDNIAQLNKNHQALLELQGGADQEEEVDLQALDVHYTGLRICNRKVVRNTLISGH